MGAGGDHPVTDDDEPRDECERGCERIRLWHMECLDCGAEVQPEDETEN